MTTIPYREQHASTTAATRAKAATLDVLNLTRREAIVAGTTGDYVVNMDELTCTCRAGAAGLHCAHVLAAIVEHARLHGFERTEFFDDAAAAIRFCVEEICAGRKPQRTSHGGYHYVVTQVHTIVGRLVIDDALPGRYLLWDEGGHLYGSFASYIAADAHRQATLETTQ